MPTPNEPRCGSGAIPNPVAPFPPKTRTQDRGPKDYALLAEVISWFDLVAVQKVKNNRRGLDGLMAALPRVVAHSLLRRRWQRRAHGLCL